MIGGIGPLAPDGPDLAQITEVALLELPRRRPSAAHVGPTNDGTPVGPALHCRSDADGLVSRTSNHNLKAIVDLKISGGRTGRICELHCRTLGDCRNDSYP